MVTYNIQPGATVAIDVAATGLLKAFAHDRTITAPLTDVSIAADPAADVLDVPLQLVISGRTFEPDRDGLNGRDYKMFMKNLQGPDVLNLKAHPDVRFEGRYTGDWSGGTVNGTLHIGGQVSEVSLTVTVAKPDDTQFNARGLWEGRLTELGIQPFKALMGALKLKDWARLHFECSFAAG